MELYDALILCRNFIAQTQSTAGISIQMRDAKIMLQFSDVVPKTMEGELGIRSIDCEL